MGVKGVKRVPARGAPADQQNALLEDYYYYYLAWHQGNEIAMMPFSPLGT